MSIIKKSFILLSFLALGVEMAFCEKELYSVNPSPELVSSNSVKKLDENLEPLAQLDIITEVPRLKFNGSAVLETIQTYNGYTVYLLDGARTMEISAEGYLPITISFSPSLKGGNEYRYSISSREAQGGLKFGWIDNASNDVYIDNAYAGTTPLNVQLPTGPHNITVKETGSGLVLLQQQVIINQGEVADLGILSPGVQKEVSIKVNTDPSALILIDSQLPKGGSYNNQVTVPSGTHDVIAIQEFNFTKDGGQTTYTDVRGAMKRGNYSSRSNTVDLPLAGSLTLSKASTDYPNLNIRISPKKSTYTQKFGTIVPKRTSPYLKEEIYPLLGEYDLFFTANGYKDKRATITVEPGQEATYTIKLDRAKPYYFVMYNGSINNYLGLEIAGCGKYFGWYGRFGGIGAYDPEDENSTSQNPSRKFSFSAATGPMFTILRTRTWWYLQVGGGYMRKFYNEEQKVNVTPMEGWLAEAAIVARIPFGLSIKIGYSYPFVGDPKYSLNYQNIQLGIGAAF